MPQGLVLNCLASGLMSRPDIYDDGMIEAVVERIVSGEAIYSICSDKKLPTKDNLYRALAKDEKLAITIARAKMAQQDAIIEECREIADNATPEDVQVARLRIWQRQWEAGRLAPKKYGDKLALAGDKENPLQVESAVKFYLPDNGRN